MIGGPPGMAHLIFAQRVKWPGRSAKLFQSQPPRRGGGQGPPVRMDRLATCGPSDPGAPLLTWENTGNR
jgi:hypothetical protein